MSVRQRAIGERSKDERKTLGTGSAVRQSYRAKRFKPNDPRLTEAVLAVCREAFEEFAGRPWDERNAAYGKLNEVEQKARDLFMDLRRTMLSASAFAKENVRVPVGPGSALLKAVVADLIDPALRQPRFDATPTWSKSAPLLNGRTKLISIWDKHDMLGLPRRSDGDPRMLSHRELAIISLLSGQFPKSLATYTEKTRDGKVTVAAVIDAERQIIGGLIEKHGAKWTAMVPREVPDEFDYDWVDHDWVPAVILRGPEKK